MAELIFNLWAVYDADVGLIYALAGKAYAADGCDEEKLQILRALSRTDHVTATRYKVPSRFKVHYADGTEKESVATLSIVDDPNASLFESIFLSLEQSLPQEIVAKGGELLQEKQNIPADPLCAVTVLYEDASGNITSIVTDADRDWVRQQEMMRGR